MTYVRRNDNGGFTRPNPPEQPSEAVTDEMIDAGVRAWLNAGGYDCDSADLVGPIYLAMQRAATPAPVQDDDAAFLRTVAYGDPETKARFKAIAARLSTDTALVEALKNIRERIIGGLEVGEPQLQMIDKALASRGGDNGKTA